ncbi:MAG: hypothetical protein HC905_22140 [Bacteroidales bacterium]|nr:hypothetical protein [Bacteroidales bacterium]
MPTGQIIDLALQGRTNSSDEIIRANPKTVVVMLTGTAVEFGAWLQAVPALLHHSYLGMEGGNAIADVLEGIVNPCGKLPYTFPIKLEDSPAHHWGEYPGKDGKVHYTEGIFVGYRYFDTKNVAPLYPFGYGLSYTTFEYGQMRVQPNAKTGSKVKVSFEVKNTGTMEGKEISQIYVRDVESSVERPLKELKSFTKTALAPGESKVIVVELNEKAFQFYHPEQRKWLTEPGKFEILVGSSSMDIRLTSEVELN